jgi:leader peptidase (prepilin peptidase)/N-methyltransferase
MPETIADGLPFWILKLTILALGASLGSFANVLIHRMPRHESIVRPGSRCPACQAPIRWFDNIPVLGWILLRARCRDCGAQISMRYPLIELSTAVLALACLFLAVVRGGGTADTVGLLVLWVFPFSFCFLLMVITFIDLAHWEIPHVLTITGMIAGIAGAVALGPLSGVSWVSSLAGLALGVIPIVLIIEIYFRLTKREGMGFGDAMLMGMVGATLGARSIPFVLLAASLQGLVFAVPMALAGKDRTPPWQQDNQEEAPAPEKGIGRSAVPFGPFIALGAMEWLFFGDAIWEWFWRF